jgi:hypothetical protein
VRDARGREPNSGRICKPPKPEGEGTWSNPAGETGRMLCFLSDRGNWWYIWTQPSTRTIGFASADDPRELFNFWRARSILRPGAADESIGAADPAAGESDG